MCDTRPGDPRKSARQERRIKTSSNTNLVNEPRFKQSGGVELSTGRKLIDHTGPPQTLRQTYFGKRCRAPRPPEDMDPASTRQSPALDTSDADTLTRRRTTRKRKKHSPRNLHMCSTDTSTSPVTLLMPEMCCAAPRQRARLQLVEAKQVEPKPSSTNEPKHLSRARRCFGSMDSSPAVCTRGAVPARATHWPRRSQKRYAADKEGSVTPPFPLTSTTCRCAKTCRLAGARRGAATS